MHLRQYLIAEANNVIISEQRICFHFHLYVACESSYQNSKKHILKGIVSFYLQINIYVC